MPEDMQAPENQPTTPPIGAQPSMAPPVLDSSSAPAANPTPMQQSSVVAGQGKRTLKLQKPVLIAVIAVAAALLIGGGFVFGFYLPNTPDNVYSAGLENTGKAVDQLIAYSKTQQSTDYKGADFDGTLKFKSPDASFDFDMNGSADVSGNLSAAMNLDLLGDKGSANIRSVHAAGNDSPDLYLQVNGIKKYLDSNGMNALDSLDGQWISIDHTLLDTYKSQVSDLSGGVDLTTAPTYAEVQDAEAKVQTVNRQYLYTTNSSTAVLANEQYVGQSTENGRALNRYKVGYNKDHLKAYVKALGAALDSSKLNDWSKKANNGKNLSDVMELSQMQSDISSAKGDYTFDLWVDTGTKLIGKVTFTDTDPADKGGTFTVAQNYTGGDEYPFSVSVNVKDSSGNPQAYTVSSTLNTATNKVTVSLNGTSKDGSGTTSIDLTLHATPSKQNISVSAPAGAKSVNDILNELGLGGLVPSASSGSSLSSDTPLIFQQ